LETHLAFVSVCMEMMMRFGKTRVLFDERKVRLLLWRGCREMHGVDGAGLAEYSLSDRETVRGLEGRSLARIDDYSAQELHSLLRFSRHLKSLCKNDALPRPLEQKSVACIFQKRSTRTRVSTETGLALLGGYPIFLSSEDIQLGVNESLRDTAQVLSRYNTLILARVFGHNIIDELVQWSEVPVINALSDMHHPLQILADMMTIEERFGEQNVPGKTLAWVGDGNNVLHDLMLACPMMGVDIRICTPESYRPDNGVLEQAKTYAAAHATKIWLGSDPMEAVKNASIVVTDTWVSMGQEEEAEKRLKAFEGYEITMDLMSKGNARDDWIFMHCLPRHKEEVSDEVFYSDRSEVFQEAEARMYTVMAVMLSQLGISL